MVLGAHHAQVGHEGREGVVGHLGLGRRDAGYESALARVGQPDEGDVGHELELDVEPALLCHLALLGEGWGPSPVGQEAGVALASPPAAGGHPPVAGRSQIGQRLAVLAAHDGALGHLHHRVGTPGSVPALPLAVAALLGPAMGVVPEGQQRGHVPVGHQPHVSAGAAVAAVRAAAGDVGLTPEADGARAAVAPLDVELGLVRELGHAREGSDRALPHPEDAPRCRRPHPRARPAVQPELGCTSTSLRPLRLANFTVPSVVANSVSSPPRPTLSPGWNLVPRWRTRMAPARTAVPSKVLTPRRWAVESRPLRVEPPPLVLDMKPLLGLAPADAGYLDRRVLL